MRKLQSMIFLVLILSSVMNLNGKNQASEEVLSNRAICIKLNEEITLSANLGERVNDKSVIYWTSSDPVVASVSDASNTSVKIKGLSLGQCNVTLFVDRRPISSCRVIVDDDGVIKILAIGNSFSEDAIEQNLYEIITSEGIPVIIGNMYIPGCSLETHLKNAKADAADYSYRKVTDGYKKTTEKVRMSDILVDENWDFVTLQQASHFSGIYSTYERDLPSLLEYVKTKNPKKETKYALHQTWAYSNASKHDGFRNYNNDQQTMYKKIVSANDKASELVGIETIIPAGTAIQNGRASFIGDNFNRDGYHLDLHLGRYTASCTWAEKLLGLNILTNPYIPQQLTMDEIMVARIAADNAVNKSAGVTH